jgi:hypothetical protein
LSYTSVEGVYLVTPFQIQLPWDINGEKNVNHGHKVIQQLFLFDASKMIKENGFYF